MPDRDQAVLDYYSRLYEQATGWLGWSHDAAIHAHPVLIQIAMQGALDREYSTNPYLKRPKTVAEKLKEALGGAGPSKPGRF